MSEEIKYFHIFQEAKDPTLAVCGYRAKAKPVAQRESVPKCAACLEWFKAMQWKREETK